MVSFLIFVISEQIHITRQNFMCGTYGVNYPYIERQKRRSDLDFPPSNLVSFVIFIILMHPVSFDINFVNGKNGVDQTTLERVKGVV